jgi:PQQ-dependent catabolism-associated CXXCW motif protein
MPTPFARGLVRRATVAAGIVVVAWLFTGQTAQVAQSTKSATETARKETVATPTARVPEPDDYRHDDYRTPVPATLKGATVLDGAQAQKLWASNTAVFIDVYPRPPKPANLPAGTLWRDPSHQSIEHAKWLPNVGYGVLSETVDSYFRTTLLKLTQQDRAKPVVFFCVRNCWMSWNAAKRALAYGHTNVYWFPDGTDAWQEIGQLVVDVQPEK